MHAQHNSKVNINYYVAGRRKFKDLNDLNLKKKTIYYVELGRIDPNHLARLR